MRRPVSGRHASEGHAGRIDALDGIRGIAILLVFWRHFLGHEQGWMGVDVFFVLSGFLITTILVSERDRPRYWKMFYVRRVARIAPAYLLLLAMSTLAGRVNWPLLWPYLLFFGGNVGVLLHTDAMEFAGFAILWSLAVEEHFYFVWPALVRSLRGTQLVRVLVGVVVLSPVARVVATLCGVGSEYIYRLTPFRLDGLALGGLLALVIHQETPRRLAQRFAGPAAALSIAVLVLGVRWFDNNAYPLFNDAVGYTLIAFATAATIGYLLAVPGTLAHRLLAWTPLATLGRISYGVYLYHIFFRELFTQLAARAGYFHMYRAIWSSLLFSFVFAWLSHRYFESVFTRWARRRIAGYVEEEAVAAQSAA